jgi:serine/threonine-protein kinase HipA
MASLVVELYGTRAGTLTGPWRTFGFLPDEAAVTRFGIDSPILSVAIPLTAVAVRSRKERRQNFFKELLPEGRMLTRLAQQAGVVEQDVIGMLRAYGRDIAGALQIWDPDVPGEPKQPALEPLSSAGVAEMLGHVLDNPLGNKPLVRGCASRSDRALRPFPGCPTNTVYRSGRRGIADYGDLYAGLSSRRCQATPPGWPP